MCGRNGIMPREAQIVAFPHNAKGFRTDGLMASKDLVKSFSAFFFLFFPWQLHYLGVHVELPFTRSADRKKFKIIILFTFILIWGPSCVFPKTVVPSM